MLWKKADRSATHVVFQRLSAMAVPSAPSGGTDGTDDGGDDKVTQTDARQHVLQIGDRVWAPRYTGMTCTVSEVVRDSFGQLKVRITAPGQNTPWLVALDALQLEDDPSAELVISPALIEEMEVAEKEAKRREWVENLRRADEARQEALEANPLWASLVTADRPPDDMPVLVRHGKFVIPSHVVVGVIGKKSAGKSYLTGDLACSLATGVPWLGADFQVEPLRVVYLQLEDQPNRGHNRVMAWCLEHGVDPEALMASPQHQRNKLWWHRPQNLDFIPHGDQELSSGVAHLLQFIDLVGADVVVLDNLTTLLGRAGHMSPGAIGAVWESFRAITYSGTSVILLGHTNAHDDPDPVGQGTQGTQLDATIHVQDHGNRGRTATMARDKDSAGHPVLPFVIEDSKQWDEDRQDWVGVVRSKPSLAAKVREVQAALREENGGEEPSATAVWKRVGGRRADVFAAVKALEAPVPGPGTDGTGE